MKKFISLTAALAVFASVCSFNTFAEEPSPANIDPAAYEQLLKYHDLNEDGVLTDEELHQIRYLSLELDEVEDISWFSEMQELIHISIRNGSVTDLSVLGDLPKLKNVFMDNVPITDIDFAKKVELDFLRLSNMEQITYEQRMEVVRGGDIILQKGYSAPVAMLPQGIFDSDEVRVYIGDTDIAAFNDGKTGTDEKGNYRRGEAAAVYGNSCGETDYTISYDGEGRFTGRIKVTETEFAGLPEVSDRDYRAEKTDLYYYGSDSGVVIDGKLYALRDGEMYLCGENIIAHDHIYYKVSEKESEFGDGLVFADGTASVNNRPVNAPEGVRFRAIKGDYLIDELGDIYHIRFISGEFTASKVGEDCDSFIGDYLSSFALSKNGNVMCVYHKYSGGEYIHYIEETDIKDPKKIYHDYVIGGDDTLWYFDTWSSVPKLKFISADVADVGFMSYSNGMVASACYVKTDGSAYTVEKKPVVISERDGSPYKEADRFRVDRGEIMSSQLTPCDYFISYDNVLTMNLFGNRAAIKDVGDIIGAYYSEGVLTVYFVRLDNTIWKYVLGENRYEMVGDKPIEEENVMGDLNDDGLISVADAVLMQKLLTSGEAPANAERGDLDGDGDITVFDFVLMRKLLADR